MQRLTLSVPFIGVFGMAVAYLIYASMKRRPDGNDLMRSVASQIHEGAMAFLKREYSILIFLMAVVAALLGLFLDVRTAFAFVSGALCSILAGFFGMQAATRANVRTAEAARSSGQGKALLTAFDGGTVMGLSVASIGLVGVDPFLRFFVSVVLAPVLV